MVGRGKDAAENRVTRASRNTSWKKKRDGNGDESYALLSRVSYSRSDSNQRRNTSLCSTRASLVLIRFLERFSMLPTMRHGTAVPKARIRLEIGIEIRLDFDQSKQSSLNLRLVFFLIA